MSRRAIMTAIGDRKVNRWHLQIADRWVVQYNFYVNDGRWGRMHVRICPYLPFSARVGLNQHHWLECLSALRRTRASPGLGRHLECRGPVQLRPEMAGLFHPILQRPGAPAGCQHRLFFSQVEFCDNLIFHRRAALDKMGERLLDANRAIGQPNKITVIFGRKMMTKQHRGKLQTEIDIRSHYRNGFIKQYVRDHLILRTEGGHQQRHRLRGQHGRRAPAGVARQALSDRQQLPRHPADILETFVDRGQLQHLANRPAPCPANAFPASNSTIPGNWP
jgi:hypothetical protein